AILAPSLKSTAGTFTSIVVLTKARWSNSNFPGYDPGRGKGLAAMKAKILLVDDEEALLKQMRWAFDSDYQVVTASSESEALSVFAAERPPVATVDLSLNPD